MTHQIQILVVPQRVIGYQLCVPVPSLCRRTSAAEREIEPVTEHHARQSGLAQRDCAANRRIVRLQTCALPRYHDHASTSPVCYRSAGRVPTPESDPWPVPPRRSQGRLSQDSTYRQGTTSGDREGPGRHRSFGLGRWPSSIATRSSSASRVSRSCSRNFSRKILGFSSERRVGSASSHWIR